MSEYSLEHLTKPLVFLHQRRCGGNKFNFTLSYLFPEQQIIKLGESTDGSIKLGYADILEDIKKCDRKIYLGHFYYGLHNHIENAEYVTNIREPIGRILSVFTRFNKGQNATVMEQLADDFDSQNGMTKRLAGIGKLNNRLYDYTSDTYLDLLPSDDELLDRALYTLESKVASILLMDKLESSYLLFESKYSLPPIFSLSVNHLNQSDRTLKITKELVPPSWVDWIDARNKLDEKVYQYAKERVYRELASKDDRFKEKVRIRKLLTSVLSQSGKSVMTLQSVVENVGVLFARLNLYKMHEEFFEIAKLFFTHPELPKSAAYIVLKQISQATSALNETQIMSLKNLIDYKKCV